MSDNNYKNLLKSRLDERSKAIIERIEQNLTMDGHIKKEIKHRATESVIQQDSFFDLLVELKLQGIPEMSAQEIFENSKAYVNELEQMIRQVSKDYRILEIKYKGLLKDYEEVIREKK